MGFWNFISSIRDRVQGITLTVKRAGGAAYDYTCTAASKIDQVVIVDGIQKLPQYLPDSETKAQIDTFTTKLAKNAGKYAVTEGFKHIPGLYSLFLPSLSLIFTRRVEDS
ncbi:hypothetical protein CTI12_AA301940 [Artemisia annua]|uniref:Uncharacterized protein n=1 Tax=Artemisia annua TaxID=35608 RepID=A0A2U1N601_ARTAN|nr:hypothetical protein CTI12_AA301940 [Artemisia annua]